MDSNNSAIQVFNYDGSRQVRTIDRDGEVWFVAKDICDILELEDVSSALRGLDTDEKMTLQNQRSHSRQRGGAQMLNIVNEPGLYKLIFKSRKTEAKNFTRWVTHEVLPEIRRHGMYLTDKAFDKMRNDPEAFERVLKLYEAEREKSCRLQQELDNKYSAIVLGTMIVARPECISIHEAAHFLVQKGFNIGAIRLFALCREWKFLCCRSGRQWNQPSQWAIERGFFEVSVSGGFKPIPMVTPLGLVELTKRLAENQYPLLMLIESVEG